jgi:peptidoglycan hydrolase CwlO-like protein
MSTEILLVISNALTAIASFFVGKRRSDAETDNAVLRNLELSIGLYKNIIDDLKEEIHSLNLKIQDLEKKVETLYEENKKLKRHKGL